MPCENCQPTGPVIYFPPPAPPATGPCPARPIAARCIENDGVPLTCLGVTTGERLDSILQKIDNRLCEAGVSDPYGTYNLFCLSPVATQKAFAEKVASLLCSLNGNLTNFTNNIFPTEIQALQTQITDLDKAGITINCPVLSISADHDLSTALLRLSTAVCLLNDSVTNLSAVNWNVCSSSPTVPSTIQQGFNFILTQLCALSSGSGGSVTLPVFDNTNSCVPSGTTSDTLVATIVKMRSRLCNTPVFSMGTMQSSCISTAGITTLEQLLNLMLAHIDHLSRNLISQVDSGFFSLQDADLAAPCAGRRLTFSGSLTPTDRLVAVDAGDGVPGTLSDKLVSGAGIVLDTAAVAGKIVVSAQNLDDEKVKINAGDSTAGYLQDKLTGVAGDITTSVSPGVGGKLEVSASVDYNLLIDRLFDQIESDPDTKARFCAIMASCPSPCQPPSNVQAIAV